MFYLTLLLPLLLGFQSEDSLREVSPEEEAQVVERGRKAADELMKELKTALMRAVREGGPAHAVEFCSGEALDLTDSVEKEFAQLEIKRTTFKYRNPANAPDELERLALEKYREALEEESAPPDYLVQKYEQGGQLRYRYYQPLRVAGLCLTCHGDPEENIPEPVSEVLQKEYPGDRAIGYESGEFRGFIRVEMAPASLH